MEKERPPEGFEDFYEATFGTVARAVYLTLGRADEAADVAQEAFLRTWAHWDRIGRRDRPLLFTLRVARNLATSRIRHLIRHRRAMARTAADYQLEEPTVVGMEIREALAELPDRQRWAVVLCDLLGLTSLEAARIMGVSASTLRVHLARARSRLRRALDEGEELVRTPDRRR